MNPPACFLFTGNTDANRGRGHPPGGHGSFRGLVYAGRVESGTPLDRGPRRLVNTRKVNNMNTPDPTGRITQAELARRLNVSRGAVCKAVKSGRIAPDEDGLFDPVETELAWITNTRQSARREAGPGKAAKRGHSDYSQARARKESALARMAELRLEQAMGNLVSLEEMRFIWRDTILTLVGILEVLPDRLTPALMGMREYEPIRQYLEDAFNHMRQDMSDHFKRRMKEAGADMEEGGRT